MKAPKSVTNIWFSLSGLMGFLLAIYCTRNFFKDAANFQLTLFILCGTALPMIIFEIFFVKSYRNPSTGIDFSLKRPANLARVAAKLLGLYAIFGLFALIYSVFPEYRNGFYSPFYEFLTWATPIVGLLAIPYFLVLDLFLIDPQDSYWKFGMAILRKQNFSAEILQVILGWLVKAFFLPLMFIYFRRDIDFYVHFDLASVLASFSNSFEFLFRFFFSIDLLFVTIGYMCTLRLLDSHIRTTEPTFLGWGIALVCYQPFWSFFSANYLAYDSDKQWGHWLSGSSFYTIWGSGILLLIGVYVWATLAFGIRFSNLTNRGIITSGPYRFTKHPAYISKNLAWWMISMPFMVSSTFQDSLRHCVLLLGLNCIYFIRAKTEERHLGRDPQYQEYARYIQRHGIFSRARKADLKDSEEVSIQQRSGS